MLVRHAMMAYRESEIKPRAFLYTQLKVSVLSCHCVLKRKVSGKGMLSLTQWTQWWKIQSNSVQKAPEKIKGKTDRLYFHYQFTLRTAWKRQLKDSDHILLGNICANKMCLSFRKPLETFALFSNYLLILTEPVDLHSVQCQGLENFRLSINRGLACK